MKPNITNSRAYIVVKKFIEEKRKLNKDELFAHCWLLYQKWLIQL